MFSRKIYDRIKAWKQSSDGSTALLIEGARRVGKSTIVEEFAKREYRSYVLVDFAYAPSSIHGLFEDVTDLNYLFLQLQLVYGVQLYDRESLVIFDEVQYCPKARQAIKVLVKDGRYDYVETGSLISIKKNTKDILIPSEERKIQMFPMDFEEFRWALGDTATIPLLKSVFEHRTPLGDQTSRRLMRDFRLYMLVGGMPQAVEAYLQTNNLQRVDEVKRDIISLYEDDFYKIDSSGSLSRLFDSIPAQLAKKASRYQISSVLANKQVADVSDQISELIASKTVLPAYHVDDPNVGLAATVDLSRFKLYLSDTGIFVTLSFKDSEFVDNEIYPKLLADKLPANLGAVYENAVAQALTASGHSLYYHTWPKEGAHRNYEIDFVLSRGKKVCPVEVKSSRYKTHASLDAFFGKYPERVGDQYLLYTKDLRRDGMVTCLPTSLAPFL